MMKNKFFIFASVWMLTFICAAQTSTQSKVVVSHQEAVNRSQVGLEKSRVRDKALLKALMQASQSMVPAQTFEKNQALINAVFAQDIQTYVKDYRYRNQEFLGQNYLVELEVEPQWFLLKNKLTEWGVIPYEAMPMLAIDPVIVGQNVKGTPSSQYWTEQIIEHLKSLGFNAVVANDSTRLPSDAYQVSMKLVRADRKQAEAVFSWVDGKGGQRFQKTWSGAATSQESLLAGMFAIFIVEHTMPKWFAQKGDQTQYWLTVEGMEQYQDLQTLKELLGQQKNLIRTVSDHSYRADSMTMGLHLAGSIELLMQWLSAQTMGGKQLIIIDREGRNLRARLQ